MRNLRQLVILLLLSGITRCADAQEPQILPRQLLDDGWIELFDGTTLFGWQTVGDARWFADRGVVSTTGDKPGWLMTTAPWGDFELHVEFKAPAETNSGIFFRSTLEPTDPTKDCYELNIAPQENPYPTGTLVGRAKKKSIDVGDGEWHSFDVTANAGKFTAYCDGNPVLEYDDPTPIGRGHVGLQAKEGPIEFRNVRLKPLGFKSVFNGKDLTGWTLAGAEQSKFDITESGELQLKNGPGQIATEADYADFVLQLECKVNGDGLNSGVFFRALKEGRWQGYEAQINNKVIDGNLLEPADFGTGAIYRRQPARMVVPRDREWFTMTVNAAGPHFAVWVDGYQVTDWTDMRPPAENPREGLRLGPGAIAIQGHDPTTDFLFRGIEIGELTQ
jgi:3-keto-disaccharide hydrolase